MSAAVAKRRFWVPEVVQTSAMDCGPAVLKCLLEGYEIRADYGRLREACQTDVDGTSIDVLEQLACQLGLAAEQVMLPVDHLLAPESEALPAILVVGLPNGFTHFVLVWRRHGNRVQIMDPAVGRRWTTCKELLSEVYVHHHQLPATEWHEWACSDENRRPFECRLRELGIDRSNANAIFEKAASNSDWQALAALDAATRMTAMIVQANGIRRGSEARGLLMSLIGPDAADPAHAKHAIPDHFWSVSDARDILGQVHTEGTDAKADEVIFRGAVLVRVLGRTLSSNQPPIAAPTSRELAAAVAAPASSSRQRLFDLLSGFGGQSMIGLAIGLIVVCGGFIFESLLFRSVIGIGRELGTVEQRLEAVLVFAAFIALMMCIELGVVSSLFRLGRRIEVGLRIAFLEKIPRLIDRYLQSRPISDLTERSHAIHHVRLLPELAGSVFRTGVTLVMTSAAISWIEPSMAALAWTATVIALTLPLAFNRSLQAVDVRFRTHTGALSRFYLDALLGVTAVRSHGAERSLRREHESLLVEWARTNHEFFRWVVMIEGIQILVGFGLAAAIVLLHANRATDFGATLLLAYWALNLPGLAEEIVRLSRQYPMQRNLILRLIEPLGAPEEPDDGDVLQDQKVLAGKTMGVSLAFQSVNVHAAGHTILHDVDLKIEPGSHVAIVGVSGAGKSSLVGLLLGWHRAATGQVLVDEQPQNAARLEKLRNETAWVDPAVQIWNRSLLGNLLYGAESSVPTSLGSVLDDADLYDVVERLPEGMQTLLGEGGGLVSGGEGQRVRFGRSLVRRRIRLAILDEPFRGLDREKRRGLLRRARQHWKSATLLCVTHDVSETLDFERVLVIENGCVIEDGAPAQLRSTAGSRYGQLLLAESEIREGLWAGPFWRRLQLMSGRLQTNGAPLP